MGRVEGQGGGSGAGSGMLLLQGGGVGHGGGCLRVSQASCPTSHVWEQVQEEHGISHYSLNENLPNCAPMGGVPGMPLRTGLVAQTCEG